MLGVRRHPSLPPSLQQLLCDRYAGHPWQVLQPAAAAEAGGDGKASTEERLVESSTPPPPPPHVGKRTRKRKGAAVVEGDREKEHDAPIPLPAAALSVHSHACVIQHILVLSCDPAHASSSVLAASPSPVVPLPSCEELLQHVHPRRVQRAHARMAAAVEAAMKARELAEALQREAADRAIQAELERQAEIVAEEQRVAAAAARKLELAAAAEAARSEREAREQAEAVARARRKRKAEHAEKLKLNLLRSAKAQMPAKKEVGREQKMMQSIEEKLAEATADMQSLPGSVASSLPPRHQPQPAGASKRPRVLIQRQGSAPVGTAARGHAREQWIKAHPGTTLGRGYMLPDLVRMVRAAVEAEEGGTGAEVGNGSWIAPVEGDSAHMDDAQLQAAEEAGRLRVEEDTRILCDHYDELMRAQSSWRSAAPASVQAPSLSDGAIVAPRSPACAESLLLDPCDTPAQEEANSFLATEERECAWVVWPSGSILRKGIKQMAAQHPQRRPSHAGTSAAQRTVATPLPPTNSMGTPVSPLTPRTPLTHGGLNRHLLQQRTASHMPAPLTSNSFDSGGRSVVSGVGSTQRRPSIGASLAADHARPVSARNLQLMSAAFSQASGAVTSPFVSPAATPVHR